MCITITDVLRPHFSSASGDRIDLDLTTEEYGVISCTVGAQDLTPYRLRGEVSSNADLFARATAGQFGPVSAYISPLVVPAVGATTRAI